MGYKRVSCLREELAIAHADGSLRKLHNQLAKIQLLILDDFGLVPLSKRGRSDMLEVLDDLVDTGATIVAGQMLVMRDKLTSFAMLDQ